MISQKSSVDCRDPNFWQWRSGVLFLFPFRGFFDSCVKIRHSMAFARSFVHVIVLMFVQVIVDIV
jgi:hypothetical protein